MDVTRQFDRRNAKVMHAGDARADDGAARARLPIARRIIDGDGQVRKPVTIAAPAATATVSQRL